MWTALPWFARISRQIRDIGGFQVSEAILPGCDLPAVRRSPQKDEAKKPRLRPIDRRQMVLHPIDIERLVPEDHEVRAIWELVGSLDLSCYYDQLDSVEGNAGAPAFDPRLLVSPWVYAYSKGVGDCPSVGI